MNKLATAKPGSRLSRLLLLVAALVAGAALAGCGGDDEEEAAQDVEEVVVAYGDSDGAEACDFLSASALDQLGGESGCTRQFETVGPAELSVTDVTVEGDTATAQVENTGERGGEFELELVNEDGEWKISVFPGLDTIAPAEPTEPPPPGDGGETAPEDETAPEGETTAPEGETSP